MSSLYLQSPCPALKEKALDYKREHFVYGETDIYGSALLDEMEYEEWLESLAQPGIVPSSTFFACRKQDARVVGMVNIRHSLNEYLATYAGHIGYGVRPSERRKGYGTEILKLALGFAKSIGLERVMVVCYKENTASRRTILACGGVLERELAYENGNILQVYFL